MLSELQGLHAQIEANLEALDALTALAEPPHTLSAVRLSLTRASRRRTMLIESLYPQLTAKADGRGRAELEGLRAEAKTGLVTSARHIGEWTLREIASNWAGYCAASHIMRAAMRDRIHREIAVIYPLIEERSEAA